MEQVLRASDTMPDLGRLKAAAERVSMAVSEVNSFLTRFRGPRNEQAGSGTAVPQPPDTYRNDIESLFEQISHLETQIAMLRDIG